MNSILITGNFNIALIVLVSVFALIKGGMRERVGAAAYLIDTLCTTFFARLIPQNDKDTVFVYLLIVDITCLVVFLCLRWKYNPTWPVWASAFQMVAVIWDVLTIFDQTAYTRETTFVLYLSTYCVLASIVWGTIEHMHPKQNQRINFRSNIR
jgi:hypothetical protein